MTLIISFRASSDELRKSENDSIVVKEIKKSLTLITFLNELDHSSFEGKKVHTVFFYHIHRHT